MEFDQAKIIVNEVRCAMENISNAGVVIDHINDADLKEEMKIFIAKASKPGSGLASCIKVIG